MMRTKLSVLLVVLGLLCACTLQHAVALAEVPDGALVVPSLTKHANDQIIDTSGAAGDDNEGDPDSLTDGFGYNKSSDLVNGADGIAADQVVWLQVMMQVMNGLALLR